MYSFVLAVYLAYNITGEPVNPCVMEVGEAHYRTRQQCEGVPVFLSKISRASSCDQRTMRQG